MTAEEPSFSSKPLTEPSELKTKPKKTMRKKTATAAEHNKQNKIAKQLTQIYQDNEGHLPDMKKIKITKSRPAFRAFMAIVILGGLLAAAAWAGFLFMPSDKKFSENQIDLKVTGPTEIVSGATTTYKIIVENNQNQTLKKVTLNVQYPEGFMFLSSGPESKNAGHTEWHLDNLGSNKKQEISITGLTYGSMDQKQSWRVFLTYRPENFGSELQKASILDVSISQSPFSLAVNGPSKVLIGNEAVYTFLVKKEYDSQTKKLELKPLWPQNFFITSSSPALNKDRKWLIEQNKTTSSVATDNWTFKIVGKFTSSTAETGEISGALFTTAANNSAFNVANAKSTTELTQNDLDFNLAINGSLANFSAQPADSLNITVSVKNASPDELNKATLKLTLDAPSLKRQSLLDWAKIEDKYDGDIRGIQINDATRRGEIVWNQNKIPALAKINKNEEIILDIRLPVKDNSTFDLAGLTGASQIIALAEISFKDKNNISQNFSSNQIIITVNSDLKFEARDSVSQSGGGEKHQITWVLTNNFHPLKNLVLSADVYGNATVEPESPAPAGEAKFDTANKKITWTIPEMPATVDVLALPIAITLNNLNPTQKLLVSKVHIQAEDTVTGEKLDFMGEEIPLNN